MKIINNILEHKSIIIDLRNLEYINIDTDKVSILVDEDDIYKYCGVCLEFNNNINSIIFLINNSSYFTIYKSDFKDDYYDYDLDYDFYSYNGITTNYYTTNGDLTIFFPVDINERIKNDINFDFLLKLYPYFNKKNIKHYKLNKK